MKENCKKIKKTGSTKPVHLNPFVHHHLKLAATQRDLTIAEYANILLGRSLGLVDSNLGTQAVELEAVTRRPGCDGRCKRTIGT